MRHGRKRVRSSRCAIRPSTKRLVDRSPVLAGLSHIVTVQQRDVQSHGFPEAFTQHRVDGVFLDVPEPWKVRALPGGVAVWSEGVSV